MREKIIKFIGITSIKDVLEIASWISMCVIAFMTWKVYDKQLKLDEHLNEPRFEISVVQENLDGTFEQYLQVINNGSPIEDKQIETDAVLWLERTENEDDSTLKKIPIKVENFFYNQNDKMNYSNAKTGIICKRETNFHYRDIQNEILKIRSKLNDSYEKTIQVYSDFTYFVKISYKDYSNEKKFKYYEVGSFNSKEISEDNYNQMLKLQGIDVNKEYHDDLVDILK